MMKRLVSFLLTLVMILPLAACGEGGLNLNPGGGKSGEKEGYIGDTLSTRWFDFVVNDAYSCAQYHDYTAAPGNQLVVATITLKNNCGQSVDMWGDDFVILWDSEDDNAALALPGGISGDQFPDEYVLGINESRSGLAVYEVPEDFRDFALAFQEIMEDSEDPSNEEGVEGDTFFVTFTPEKK